MLGATVEWLEMLPIRNLAAVSRRLGARFLGTQSSSKTIDDGEIHRFNQQINEWWDPKGYLAALHSFNKLRVPLVRDTFGGLDVNSPTPLKGKYILDVGCGGGILSKPLARLGANVVGLDAGSEGIKAALHQKELLSEPILEKNLSYVCAQIEDFIEGREEMFDMVVASEVLEHVSSVDAFVDCCVKLIKPGGHMVTTTINRTQASYWLAIIGAEYVCGVVRKGTHDWNKFIKPEELENTFNKYGCRQTLLHGIDFNVLTNNWSWSNSTAISYASCFHKPGGV